MKSGGLLCGPALLIFTGVLFMKKGEITVNVIIICFSLAMLLYSLSRENIKRFGEVGGSFWPDVILLLLLLCSVALLIQNVIAYRKEKKKGSSAPEISADDLKEKREGRKRLVFSAIVLLVYIFIMPLIGFILSTPLFVAAFVYALGEKRKKVLYLAPPLITAGIVLLFGTFIGIRFPRGPEFFATISRFFY
jgi:putative tricarboxylic transport membrane protein